MKSKVALTAGLAVLALSLSGCSYFYPHAGETPTPSQSASETASPSATPTETTPVVLKNVSVEINISEDDGICTLTVISGGVSKSVSAKAESNVTDTQCFPLALAVTGMTPGNATATVSYKSSKSQGTSSSATVVIP